MRLRSYDEQRPSKSASGIRVAHCPARHRTVSLTMCNLYRNYSSLEEIRPLFRVSRVHSSAGNLAPHSEIHPGYEAPVIRLADDCERELGMMSWGFVLPQKGRSPKWVSRFGVVRARPRGVCVGVMQWQ